MQDDLLINKAVAVERMTSQPFLYILILAQIKKMGYNVFRNFFTGDFICYLYLTLETLT